MAKLIKGKTSIDAETHTSHPELVSGSNRRFALVGGSSAWLRALDIDAETSSA